MALSQLERLDMLLGTTVSALLLLAAVAIALWSRPGWGSRRLELATLLSVGLWSALSIVALSVMYAACRPGTALYGPPELTQRAYLGWVWARMTAAVLLHLLLTWTTHRTVRELKIRNPRAEKVVFVVLWVLFGAVALAVLIAMSVASAAVVNRGTWTDAVELVVACFLAVTVMCALTTVGEAVLQMVLWSRRRDADKQRRQLMGPLAVRGALLLGVLGWLLFWASYPTDREGQIASLVSAIFTLYLTLFEVLISVPLLVLAVVNSVVLVTDMRQQKKSELQQSLLAPETEMRDL